jgi:hypothetical protein
MSQTPLKLLGGELWNSKWEFRELYDRWVSRDEQRVDSVDAVIWS